MSKLLLASCSIRNVNVTDEPSGDKFRRITIAWLDARDKSHRRVFMGESARRVHRELAIVTGESDEARAAYLVGLISAFSIISEKLPQLAVV